MQKRSLTGKRWQEPQVSHNLAALFAQRGIDPHKAPVLHAPDIFPDMQRAVERIKQAISAGEHIGIFGDYDCDGVTAVAQLVRYFERSGVTPWVRLPHRERDGYGLKRHIVHEAVAHNISLLITADTGITAVEEVRMLKEHGIDTIITDHHSAHPELPLAYALIHPVLCTYPAPHPCGAGVVFKLISALEGGAYEGRTTDSALAMLGTVADLVELRGENRAVVQLGLTALSTLSDEPLAALRDACINAQTITARDVAFRIAPRINAAGRMAEPDIALRALLRGGTDLAALTTLNTERQDITQKLLEEALAQFDERNLPPVLVSVSETYPHGIVGLIAGKLTETFGRPSLVAHCNGETCTASLRSTPAYHVTLGLEKCSDLLQSFGGHAQAAGCTFTLENLPALRARLCEDVRSTVDTGDLAPTMQLDIEVDIHQITPDLCAEISQLEPFGQGNPEPLLLIRNVDLAHMRPCGQEGKHLTGRIGGIKGIGFGLGHLAEVDGAVDIAATIEMSEWNGVVEPQLVIKDIAEASVVMQK